MQLRPARLRTPPPPRKVRSRPLLPALHAAARSSLQQLRCCGVTRSRPGRCSSTLAAALRLPPRRSSSARHAALVASLYLNFFWPLMAPRLRDGGGCGAGSPAATAAAAATAAGREGGRPGPRLGGREASLTHVPRAVRTKVSPPTDFLFRGRPVLRSVSTHSRGATARASAASSEQPPPSDSIRSGSGNVGGVGSATGTRPS